MRGLLEVFSLELKALVRSRTLAFLLVASVGWMLVFPVLVRGDGTPDGVRELYVHYSLGGVFALLLISLLASATGSLARERVARRLQLTMVRPVRCFFVVLGKLLAHVVIGALVLALACLVLLCKVDGARPCSHVLSPVMPSPREEAKAMYADYMRDPQTPDVVRKAKPSVVLRLLENRAADHYQTIATNETAIWTFRLPASLAPATPLGIRLRFTNQYEMRQDVRGVFTSGGYRGVVSNITQAVVTVPFAGEGLPESRLEFANRGKDVLMLRPRKDINLLIPADGFRGNLLRAYVELLAILALVVAFGLFLSAGLGRPVALFVAFVTLIVGEMSPSVVEEYPDELETKAIDRIGLIITRAAAEVTRPVSAVSPLEALAKDECVEARKAARLVATDALALPLALALLAALVLPHKQDVV